MVFDNIADAHRSRTSKHMEGSSFAIFSKLKKILIFKHFNVKTSNFPYSSNIFP